MSSKSMCAAKGAAKGASAVPDCEGHVFISKEI